MLKYKNNIKMFRAKNSFTQAQLAEKIGLTRVAFLDKERGKRDFTVSEALKLISIFKVPFESLFFNIDAHKTCNT